MLVFRWIIYGCIIMQNKPIFLSDFLFQLEKQKYMIYMYTKMHWLSLFTLMWFCQLTFEENKCFLRRHTYQSPKTFLLKMEKKKKESKEKDGTCSFQWRSLGTSAFVVACNEPVAAAAVCWSEEFLSSHTFYIARSRRCCVYNLAPICHLTLCVLCFLTRFENTFINK